MISEPLRDLSGVVAAVESFRGAVEASGFKGSRAKRRDADKAKRKRERQGRRKGRKHG